MQSSVTTYWTVQCIYARGGGTVGLVVRIEELIAEHHPGIILLGDGAQSAMLRKAVLKVLSKISLGSRP